MKKSKRQTPNAEILLVRAIGIADCAPRSTTDEIKAAIIAYGNQRAADAIRSSKE